MKVLSLMPFDEAYREKLRELAKERCQLVFGTPNDSPAVYQENLRTADIILGDVPAEDLRFCEHLQWMQTTWAGVDQFVRCGYLKQGQLCNMTGGYGPGIAEYLMGAILTLMSRFPEYRRFQNDRFWHPALYSKSLEGSTVLILGAGDIGTELARRLRPNNCRIVGVRRTPRACPPEYDEVITLKALDTYLPQADVVVCVLPSTPETIGLLDRKTMEKMKKDAVLVNVGRGTLIVTEDLCDLLEEGHFFGVCLDVTSPEPLPADHRLWSYDRVMITPHVAGNAFAPGGPSERRIWDRMIDNFRRYLNGEPCESVVDFETGYRKL